MTYSISLGNWTDQKPAAQTVRHEVFIIEQKIPADLEWDDWDESSLHAVAFDNTRRPIGTARLLPDGHIGRMAVVEDARGQGIGSTLLRALMQEARRRGDQAVMLHAQKHALDFYLRHGFECIGAEFTEAGIPHVFMRISFS